LYDTPSTKVEYADAPLYTPSWPVLYEAVDELHSETVPSKAKYGCEIPPAPLL
jgi:hypothetical protein